MNISHLWFKLNQKFLGVFPLKYFCPLGPHNSQVFPITQINRFTCLRVTPVWEGGGRRSFLLPLSLLWFYRKNRLLSPKPIWVLIIVEYSTISLLYYFEDTLANMGLPESWLEWPLNNVTKFENGCIKRELDWIKKLSQIQPKTVSQIKSETTSWIRLETVSQIKS